MAKTPNTHTAKNDPSDMFGAIVAWPEQLRTGYARDFELDTKYGSASQIVVCGMGGSAIAASLAGGLFAEDLTVPFTVNRDYALPGFVDKETLVIAISHSGTTEETVACYLEARERGAKVMVVTSGGDLADMAAQDGVPLVTYEYAGEPRAAVPLVFGMWIKLLESLGYIPNQADSVSGAAAELDTIVGTVQSTEENLAAELADALVGKVPVVYSAGFLGEAARRTKGQISENAKQTSAWEILPEQNHNALVGYEFPKGLSDSAVFVLLRSSFDHPRNAVRYDFMRELLKKRGLSSVQIEGTGPDKLAHLVTIVFWGDLMSYDLAVRNGVDPTPVKIIGELKARLKEST